ncbi:uncharacterized protein LOC124293267 [Neodiprion lecontei]|uniref:Uncharacterized protein LOC124293267 n=1 Tax=Neodiprion lecontei TaxID=441921 RepID=A0ABM3FN76_NEOLC|nr:uncharacterized protein LOC124293267 [Neodiprion lecontei]
MRTKWQKARRTEAVFLPKNTDWLSTFVVFENNEVGNSIEKEESPAVRVRGRPTKSFENSGERTKRREIGNIRNQSRTEELATQMNIRAEGKLDAAKVMQDVTVGSPTSALKCRQSLRTVSADCYSDDAALSLMIEYHMSKHMYQGIRSGALALNSKIYPSYKCVLQAKKKCYSPKDDITITESRAEVKLQALLDHTANRILSVQEDVLTCLSSDKISEMNLICKWGCDWTSGQSTFKQKFSNDDRGKSDATIFFTSLVPLQLMFVDEVNNKT